MFVPSAAQTISGPSESSKISAIDFQEERYLHTNVQGGNCLLDSKFVKKKIKVNRSLGNRKHLSIRTQFRDVFHPKDMELKVRKHQCISLLIRPSFLHVSFLH